MTGYIKCLLSSIIFTKHVTCDMWRASPWRNATKTKIQYIPARTCHLQPAVSRQDTKYTLTASHQRGTEPSSTHQPLASSHVCTGSIYLFSQYRAVDCLLTSSSVTYSLSECTSLMYYFDGRLWKVGCQYSVRNCVFCPLWQQKTTRQLHVWFG